MPKKNKEPSKKTIPQLDFRHVVDCTYDSNNSNCQCSDLCRCSRIINARVTGVDSLKVAKHIANGILPKNPPIIDLYCLDRILSILKIWDRELWEISTCQGYYGEEINSVGLPWNIANEIQEKLDEILELPSINQKVEALLVLEYGYLLPELDGCEYSIIEIPKKEILFQREHYTRLDRTAVKQYEDYDLPRGVCLLKNDQYRLIDGYHRMAAANGDSVTIIEAFKNY